MLLSKLAPTGRFAFSRVLKGQAAFLSTKQHEFIKVERVGEKQNVVLITMNRPKARNALCKPLMDEVEASLFELDHDDSVGAIVITGGTKWFAAGADIKEMEHRELATTWHSDFLQNWNQISDTSKPIIAAANGIALGGGCELVMQCDIAYAGESAQFAQPEILLGTIPGQGGTQRWPRYAGKSIAMEVNLTGCRISAQEAKEAGIISKIFPDGQPVIDEAIKTAQKIADLSPLIVRMVKEAVNSAYESSLDQGLRFERRLFHTTFSTKDRFEGMSAFLSKRQPTWRNK